MIDSLGHGGAESLMPPLLKRMKDLAIEPRVCVMQVRAGNPIAVELQKIGIPVDMIWIKNLRNPFRFWSLIRYIRRNPPDIIHTQLETSDILGTLAAWLLHIPSVSTLHTLGKSTTRIRKHWRNFLRWNSLKIFARRVIAVSNATRQHYLGLGFKKEKLVTIYNGIDPDSFSRDHLQPTSKSEILGLPEDSVILTTVAVLREQKGIQYMLHALPAIIAKVPKLHYVIVGDGEYRECLEQLSRSLGISKNVFFMNHRTNIPEILAVSDVFVFPTLEDALPTVLLEAMAAGLPIIACDVGGVPEIIENNVNGVLIQPAKPADLVDSCLHLINDRHFANRLAVEAQNTVLERFDIHRQVENLAALYRKMLIDNEH